MYFKLYRPDQYIKTNYYIESYFYFEFQKIFILSKTDSLPFEITLLSLMHVVKEIEID